MVLIKFDNGRRRQGYLPPAVTALWLLEPETALRLFEAPLDGDDASASVAPSQARSSPRRHPVARPRETIGPSLEALRASLTAVICSGVRISTSLSFSRGGVAASATLRDRTSSLTACLRAPHNTR